MKVLHIIRSLDFSGCARQVQLLAPLLAGGGVDIQVCCLDREGPWAEPLRAAGIAVHGLHWSRWFDLAAVRRLRALIARLQPDLIHAWKRDALRALALATRDRLAQVVLSSPLPDRHRLPWWDRKLLERVRALAVTGPGEAGQCTAAGLRQRIDIVRRAVGHRDAGVATMPGTARRIVFAGALDRAHGARYAVWAIDILNYLYPDAHLLIAGSGPDAVDLRDLARGLRNSQHVHFLGPVDPIDALLASAELCWVPSDANVGRQVALEALAHGCAVIAADVPCLRELIDDGHIGFIVPRGDVVALARRARMLLDDADLRCRLGSAAQARAREFQPAAVANDWRALYARLAA